MRFSIDVGAIDGPEQVLHALDAFVARVEDGVHEAEILDADRLEASNWYTSSRPDRRKLLEELAETALHRSRDRTRGPHLRRVEVNDVEGAVSARHYANTPLLVLLENDLSDGQLIRTAIQTLGQASTNALCFGEPSRVEPPALRMESRGGSGELKKFVARCVHEAADRGRTPRVVVVFDSDGEWPRDVKSHAQEIIDCCLDTQVPYTLLRKRTAENYIPDEVWRAWSADKTNSTRSAVEALLRLSPEQRDHVQLAKPGKSPWRDQDVRVSQLYSGVSPEDYNLIKEANLKGRGENMTIFALRAVALDEPALRRRDYHGDLTDIVRKIEDEL